MTTKSKKPTSRRRNPCPAQRDVLAVRAQNKRIRADRNAARSVLLSRLAMRDARYAADFGSSPTKTFVSGGVVWRNYGTVPACAEPKMRPILREVC